MQKKRFITYLLIIIVLITGYVSISNDNGLKKISTDDETQEKIDNEVEAKKGEDINILLLGTDSRRGELARTDVIIVARVNTKTNEVDLLSIPRDTRVKIKGAWDKINAAYVYGGTDLIREVTEDLLGITLDHYAIVNFQAFVQIIDDLGGIEIDVEKNMYNSSEKINLKKGHQLLDGEKALQYVRWRGDSEGDLGRNERQQKIIKTIIDELLALENMAKIPKIIGTVSSHMETDIDFVKMTKIATTFKSAKDHGFKNATIPGENKKIDGLWFYEPNQEELEKVVEELFR